MDEKKIEYLDPEQKKQQQKTDKQQQKKQKIKENQKRKQNIEDIGPTVANAQNNFKDIILENIPSSEYYERSLMHRDTINQIFAAPKNDIIITISIDGQIKFWKKIFQLIEPIKHFRCHKGVVTGAAISLNQDKLVTVCATDKTLKKFDLLNADLNSLLKFDFTPSMCSYIQASDGAQSEYLLVSDNDNGNIYIVDEEQQSKEKQIIKTIQIHNNPVKFILYNKQYKSCVSIDKKGFIELWDPDNYDFPKNKELKFTCKMDTDYFELLKKKVFAFGACLSNNGKYMALVCSDKFIRIFDFLSGKLIRIIDESDKKNSEIQDNIEHEQHKMYKLDKFEYSRRMAIERDLDKFLESKTMENYGVSIQFDENDQILVYPSILGIKYYSIVQNQILFVQGKNESSERFLKFVLYQGRLMKNSNNTGGSQKMQSDPLLIASSFKKNRFYLFSTREPEDQSDKQIQRDIFNEKPSKEEQQIVVQLQSQQQKQLQTCIFAKIETTMGDIEIELYKKFVPKTVDNFLGLSKQGYYNNLIFHRVIPNFMIQTGCPKGDGTGGESIWGGEFEDEFHPKLKHDKIGTVSMANAGPNTNGSQFFITTAVCEWLDNKHTVFGRVIKGMDVIQNICNSKKDKQDKPLRDIKIRYITIS
ncbi:peptidylprolyl isomerase domain and WD repeat 1 [Ichthyophthirius multifiliis]|uniref:peptidylprolyl isomerase n=1 Tax=Ichthyophthirius multifiliis TaxID=5932 RepID=G0QL52_ICHMU|nr:peptidylprolyl isomerase domain and WD repeat 1 [Ichthyophthirius multifiliis]EGR34052.1 peptidylprolyl isomerase domain and WD repeat 1 [Ichthyophthirius multifiliis]|eukprot:XP_004039356.1 peptidylprolyl isomerase domain and WD repeat 1 [Ichthyophthirius multifiliis]